jgi:bifunctional DNA-binding transcriptional regulator/antitoxin component of YhaV-PrlF toxin-antitoxin module
MKRQRPGSPIAETRRVVQLGDSLCITLPKSFTDKHGIKKGDDLAVVSDSILKVIPMTEIQ